jgi:hypothetical protein
MFKILLLVGWVIFLAILVFLVIRSFASESLSELRYQLRSEKERREIFSNNDELVEESNKKIHHLEEKISKHWGRKIARNTKDTFDLLPTPGEDPEGRTIEIISSFWN